MVSKALTGTGLIRSFGGDAKPALGISRGQGRPAPPPCLRAQRSISPQRVAPLFKTSHPAGGYPVRRDFCARSRPPRSTGSTLRATTVAVLELRTHLRIPAVRCTRVMRPAASPLSLAESPAFAARHDLNGETRAHGLVAAPYALHPPPSSRSDNFSPYIGQWLEGYSREQ